MTQHGQRQRRAVLVTLTSVRVGEVEVFNVNAVVVPSDAHVLLGNSFLTRFQMRRDNDVMRLEAPALIPHSLFWRPRRAAKASARGHAHRRQRQQHLA
jgi:hypothetical protein